jgi:hypothetical protein
MIENDQERQYTITAGALPPGSEQYEYAGDMDTTSTLGITPTVGITSTVGTTLTIEAAPTAEVTPTVKATQNIDSFKKVSNILPETLYADKIQTQQTKDAY